MTDTQTLTLTDSEAESEYLTSLEDHVGPDPPPQKNPSPKKEPTPSCSSFVQGILYDDAQAGVTVVDQFVAVKKVKDNLDFLSRCNDQVFERINHLNEETKLFKKKYGLFSNSMKLFLQKMNADSHISNRPLPRPTPHPKFHVLKRKTDRDLNVDKPKEKEEEEPESGAAENQQQQDDSNKNVACSECSTDGQNNGCLGCFLSIFKDNALPSQPLISEALLGSFIASLYWLQKGPELSLQKGPEVSVLKAPEVSVLKAPEKSTGKNSSLEKSRSEEQKKTGFTMRESIVQMICDICEALGGASVEMKKGQKINEQLTKVTDKVATPSEEFSCLFTGQKLFPKAPIKKTESTETVKTMAEDMNSELDSDFEQTLSPPPLSTHFDLIPKPSLTSMGDLTKERKTVPLTTAKGMSSWVDKLSNEIVSKLKKRKSKTNVRIFKEPLPKNDLDFKKLASCMEFRVTTNTPLGVFDMTVVQYKKNRFLKERTLKQKTNPLYRACDSNPGVESPASDTACNKQLTENYFTWSDESFFHADSELLSNSDNEGENEEMEEFVEIFLDIPGKKQKNGKLSRPRQMGCLRLLECKKSAALFFEIQKQCPVYLVEELLLKTPTTEEQEKPMVVETTVNEKAVIPLNTGEKQQKQVVIHGTSSDLVIYIQVEVEGGQPSKSDQVYLEYQTSSLGTQTHTSGESPEDKTIKLKEEEQTGVSLYQVWNENEVEAITELQPEVGTEELEKIIEETEEVIAVKEPKEKTVTFSDELSEILCEREIQDTYPEEEAKQEVRVQETATFLDVLAAKQRADIWLRQVGSQPVQRDEVRMAKKISKEDTKESSKECSMTVDVCPSELQKALKLIREIESDIVEVKLSDAISMLPQLESELRKHLQAKMKRLEDKQWHKEDSLHTFFSATDFFPVEDSRENSSNNSEDRLNNLLAMLSNLESAVRSNEYSVSDLCQYDSSKIYKLLHALTASIRELEEVPNVTSLSQTMEIASELDTAVREYDSIVRRQPMEYISPGKESRRRGRSSNGSLGEATVKQHLKNVRKKVFEIVEEESVRVEARIEKDFDRLDLLERENDEALMFLEAFLLKTQRRVIELSDLKVDLRELSVTLKTLYEGIKEKLERAKQKEVEIVQIKEPNQSSARNNSSIDSVCVLNTSERKELVRETVSGLLLALDTLKSKAQVKREACSRILGPGGVEKGTGMESSSSRRSSRSSFTTKNTDNLFSTIKEFKKIGQTSLYMSWTKPEGNVKGTVVGYQIHVNDRLNQKVRNPQRLQAVLYSVDLTKRAVVQLYGVVDSGQRILMATVSHHSE